MDGSGKSVGGETFAAPGGPASGREPGQLDEQYWLNLWAFGTSPSGLGLPEARLWALSLREYNALHAVYLRARGVEVHTSEEWAQKERNQAIINDQWVKARNKVYGAKNG